MHKRYALGILFLALLSTLLAANSFASTQNPPQPPHPNPTQQTPTTINIDGDVALTPEQNRMYWNPHSTGLTNASTWKTTFENETEISLETTANEAGHVATGAWWTTSFKTKEKLPLYTSKPTQVLASFKINIINITYQKENEWLRIALASATQRNDGTVVYTETDVWDSPAALQSPNGNIPLGGNTVYKGGNVIEYKTTQATLGEWKNYSVNLTNQIDSAWSLKLGDLLESAYIVIEVIGGVSVTIRVDDLWLTILN